MKLYKGGIERKTMVNMDKKYKWYQCILFVLGFIVLAAVTIYIIVVYKNLPVEVPTHFNAFNVADTYGSKDSLFTPLIIGWILYVAMTVISAFPAIWNTGVTVTEENREKVYSIIRTMISILSFLIAALFSCTVFFASQGKSLPAFAIPVFLILVFGSIIIGVVRLVKNR